MALSVRHRLVQGFIDREITQNELDIQARFFKRNVFDKLVHGKPRPALTPRFDSVWPGIIGGEGKDRVVVEGAELGGKIVRAKGDVGLGIEQLRQVESVETRLASHVSRRCRHELHEAPGTGSGDSAGVKDTFLPYEAQDEIR